MMEVFSYSLGISICLLFGYLAFALFIADVKQPRFNRVLLWGIMAFGLAMPFIPSVNWPAGSVVAAELSAGTPDILAVAADEHPVAIGKILYIVYLAGVVAVLSFMTGSLIRLIRIIRSGKKVAGGDGTVVVFTDAKTSPFSWMHYIILNKDEEADDNRMTVIHEKAHIRRGHSWDLAVAALLCVFLWYNPVVWLWRRQLALAHEYEADSDVVDAGVDIKSYQILLIKKAVGTRLQSLANNLTHSKLKKRITMMSKKQSKRGALVRTLAVVPAIVGALAVVNIPAVASALDRFSPTEVQPFGEVNQNIVVSQASDETVTLAAEKSAAPDDCLPSFPGGWDAMARYLMDNLTYPEQAKKDGLEGRVVVRFKVDTDGSIGDISVIKSLNPVLDSEAIRVVKAMPRWTPGRENGKTVAVSMLIPIEFKLK